MCGLSDEEITAIREGTLDSFPPDESALLRMADAMADAPANISDELYAELRRHFSEEQLMELAASAALENYRARFNRVFNVGSDGLYRKGLHFKQHPATSAAKLRTGERPAGGADFGVTIPGMRSLSLILLSWDLFHSPPL